jgi:hypothetical protein
LKPDLAEAGERPATIDGAWLLADPGRAGR